MGKILFYRKMQGEFKEELSSKCIYVLEEHELGVLKEGRLAGFINFE